MDENFSLFLEAFGSGGDKVLPDPEFFLKYSSSLPSCYLDFIRNEGFSSYGEGLFWTLSPEIFSPYVQAWCSQIDVLANDRYLVFARDAFGDMYALQEGSGRILSVSFSTGIIWAPKNILKPSNNFDIGIRSFFGSALQRDFDLEDESGEYLFGRGVKLFGAISRNELFGFEPALACGGTISIENLRKLRMDVHIDILSQLSRPVLRSA